MAAEDWKRVDATHRCVVCGRPDWCLSSRTGAAAICARVANGTRVGEAGWLHRSGAAHWWRTRVNRLSAPTRMITPDLTRLAERCQSDLSLERLDGFARSLGVSTAGLTALRVGWSAAHRAWTFPMTDPATGSVIGIRLRRPDGSKYTVLGGREALFLPTLDLGSGEPMVVAEGATDTAVLLDLGFAGAVGRPSCAGGVKHLVALARTRRPQRVVIVADADGPGRRGAADLASVLACHAEIVTVVAPPSGAKDVRAWRQAGASRADLDELILTAAPHRLTLRVREVRRGR